MPPSPEYLRILDELIECRDDNLFHLLQAQLKNQVHFRCGDPIPHGGFIERYIRQNSGLHIHYVVESSGYRFDLCSMLEPAIDFIKPSPVSKLVMPKNGCFGNHDIQVTVFVDVREFGKQSEGIGSSQTMVRLHTLDECKRRFGNTRKDVREAVVSRCFLWNPQPEGEKTILFPVSGQGDSAWVDFDEIERQVIYGRPELIDNLSNENGNVRPWLASDIDCFFAVRFGEEGVRACSGISPNALLKSVEVYLCPIDFENGGLDATNHPEMITVQPCSR